jgi:diguanylate cyclase (GGDEF)-like protein
MLDESGSLIGVLGIAHDITARKSDEAHIQNLAHFDQLTGLPNRILLNDRVTYLLNMAQRKNESLAVMFLDLDHFKNINDTLGHSIGDQVLIEVANRIKEALRDQDTVARLGGDEFIMLFPNTDSNAAMYIATKLIEVISKASMIENNELTITPSIGIAIYPNDGEDFETLLKNADTAMYGVKSASRNSFHFFTQEMQLNLARNLQLDNALRHALKRNELEVYYQPQISLSDGHIIGAEALVRWHHPKLGMISPAEFIPIAESSGQIIEIGEWVLRTAIQQTKEWIDGGFAPMIIAVNLSAIQFRQKNLLTRITDILKEVELPHQYLELELTEAVTMHNPESVINIMNKLYEQGIRMSIDDFGTGYSSLSYLKKFKVYKLKIDQSFIRDIGKDNDDRAIVSAIIDMAHNLGLKTIAEGVETAEQLDFLRLHGCDEVQGYYFSKPLPCAEFEIFFKNFLGLPDNI